MKFPFALTRISSHAIPILVILLITFIYAWPLASQLTVAIPGRIESTDTTETVFAIGWVHQALSHGQSVWHTDRLFSPYGADLRFNVFGLLQGLIAYPLVPSLGVIGASNFVIILAIFLNGWFAYLLTYDHIQHSISSLVAAVFHMLSIAVVWHFAVGRNALPALWIVSLSLLCLKRLLETPSIWRGILLGLSMLAGALTDLHVAVFTILWVIAYSANWFWNHGFLVMSRPRMLSISVSVLMFASATILLLFPVLPAIIRADFPIPTLDDVSHYSLSISQFVVPFYIPNIYGFDFLAAVILAIFLFGWKGEYRFWLVVSIMFLILALGPELKPTQIPLPYGIVAVWPPLQNFRAAYRFVIPATIGFTLVTGYVLKTLLLKIPSRSVALIICALLIICRAAYTIKLEPFKTQVYPTYDFYERIAKEADDFSILEIPFGIRSGLDQIGQGGERLQYYQPVHGKTILNGSLARLPVSLFSFYRSHPVLMYFSGEMSIDRSKLSDDFSDVLGWADPRYVLVHRSLISLEQSKDIESFLDNQSRLSRIGLEADLVIYEVTP